MENLLEIKQQLVEAAKKTISEAINLFEQIPALGIICCKSEEGIEHIPMDLREFFMSDETKDLLKGAVTIAFEKLRSMGKTPLFIALISEAWEREGKTDDELDRAERKEIVFVSVNGEFSSEIVKAYITQEGKKRKVGEFSEPMEIGGRFSSLFDKKFDSLNKN